MPMYDYECRACEVIFEELVKIANRLAPTEAPCPQCGEKEVRQVHLTVNIGDSVRLGVKKPGAEFNDVMDKIKYNHPLGQFQRENSRHDYDISRRNEEYENTKKKMKHAREHPSN
tara:strand:+ start:13826 stop:14170 length:345 start_codon:yes stop_codon:yes gene_type:complete